MFGYISIPACVDKMVLIFCSSSRFTGSGTSERAFGVTCLTIFSTFTLPPSSLITSRHNSRTSSFQPHSVNRKRNKSFSLSNGKQTKKDTSQKLERPFKIHDINYKRVESVISFDYRLNTRAMVKIHCFNHFVCLVFYLFKHLLGAIAV